MGGVLCGCGVGWCALRDGVVCRKARMASPRRPPAQSTALSLLSQPPVSPTALSLLSQPPVSPTMLSLLSHPPLFTYGHFRCFPSRLWRTPRTLSPCTSKYSCRVTLRHLDSRRLTQMSCLLRHAGCLLNWLWFRFLCVIMIFGC